METQNNIQDKFLKSLITNDGLESPNFDFTSRLMAKIPTRKVMIQESSRLIGKNITLLIFILIGVINLTILYFAWPYISVWIPENSITSFILGNLNNLLQNYISQLVSRSLTISLIFVIIVGSISIIGIDELGNSFHRLYKKAF